MTGETKHAKKMVHRFNKNDLMTPSHDSETYQNHILEKCESRYYDIIHRDSVYVQQYTLLKIMNVFQFQYPSLILVCKTSNDSTVII